MSVEDIFDLNGEDFIFRSRVSFLLKIKYHVTVSWVTCDLRGAKIRTHLRHVTRENKGWLDVQYTTALTADTLRWYKIKLPSWCHHAQLIMFYHIIRHTLSSVSLTFQILKFKIGGGGMGSLQTVFSCLSD